MVRTIAFRTIAVLLLLTSAVKIISAFLPSVLNSAEDPLLGFVRRDAMSIAAGSVELGVVFCLWQKPLSPWGPFLTGWLASCFLSYRVGLWATGFRGYCPCLGSTMAWLPAHGIWLDWLLKGLLGAMVITALFYGMHDVGLWKRVGDRLLAHANKKH